MDRKEILLKKLEELGLLESVERMVANEEARREREALAEKLNELAEMVAQELPDVRNYNFTIIFGQNGYEGYRLAKRRLGESNGRQIRVWPKGKPEEAQIFNTSKEACQILGVEPTKWGACDALRRAGYAYEWVE